MTEKQKTLTVLMLFAALVACTPSSTFVSTAPPDTRTPLGDRNVAHQVLLTVDGKKRAAALGLMVASSGERCTGEDTFFMGMDSKDNRAYWSVRCTNGESYMVTVKADAGGSTGVLNCAGLKAVSDVDCFVKLDDQHHAPRTQKQIKAAIDRLPLALRRQMMEQLRENIGKP